LKRVDGLVGIAILAALVLLIAFGIYEYRSGEGTMGIIRIIYVLTITAFLIMLVAFGISAFYESPESPKPERVPVPIKTPIEREAPAKDTPEYEEWQAEQEAQQEEWRMYEGENRKLWETHSEDMKTYRRNVFFIAYPCGLLFIILGLTLRPRLSIIKPGMLLGGMGTIIYAIAQSDLSNQVRFGGVAIGLAVLVYVGYRTLLERKPVAEE